MRSRVAGAAVAAALALLPPAAAAAEAPAPAPGPVDAGLIFNLQDPFDLSSYQGGIGAKVGFGALALRGLADFSVNGSSASLRFGGGVAVEYHPFSSAVSPYFGVTAKAGYEEQDSVVSILSGSFGAVAGVEVFLLDFLSVFVEYEAAVDLTRSSTGAGSPIQQDYLVESRMGNEGRIGIVFYFMRRDTTK